MKKFSLYVAILAASYGTAQAACEAPLYVNISGVPGDTIVGTNSNNDFFLGRTNPNNDAVQGLSGNDQIFVGAGDDCADGGPGNDMIGGAEGNDVLFGGSGNDSIFASFGDDFIDGGSGDDGLDGFLNGTFGTGLFGGDGNDVILGGRGRDVIIPGLGINTAQGGEGADIYLIDFLEFDIPTDVFATFTTAYDTNGNNTVIVSGLAPGDVSTERIGTTNVYNCVFRSGTAEEHVFFTITSGSTVNCEIN
jgi:hypothetical protein